MKTNSFKRQLPDFTHFISIPIVGHKIQISLQNLQKDVLKHVDDKFLSLCSLNNPNLFHLTLCMLNLRETSKKATILQIFNDNQDKLTKLAKNHRFELLFNKITCFSEENKGYSKLNDVIFVEPHLNETILKIHEISDILIKDFIKFQIVDWKDIKTLNLINDEKGRLRMNQYHLTLVRIKNRHKIQITQVIQNLRKDFKGIDIPIEFVDVSTRFEYGEDKFYKPLFRKLINE